MPDTGTSRIVGQLRVQCTGFTNRFWCDRLAVGMQRYVTPMHAFSVLGPQIQIKALAAILSSNVYVEMESIDIPFPDLVVSKLSQPENGYRFQRIKHPQGQGQLIGISDDPDFLMNLSEESLWQELSGPRFTTPLLREWMPVLRKELETRSLLQPLANFHTNCGMLRVSQEKLDEIVSYLVTNGRVTIE